MSARRSNVDRIRAIALTLPETTEEITWGTDVNFRVRKKIFCFRGDTAVTVKADPDELDALLGDDRFARAAYVGRFGWVTMTLRPARGLGRDRRAGAHELLPRRTQGPRQARRTAGLTRPARPSAIDRPRPIRRRGESHADTMLVWPDS